MVHFVSLEILRVYLYHTSVHVYFYDLTNLVDSIEIDMESTLLFSGSSDT